MIDFRRDKIGEPATVAALEYDPNRSARIALLQYADGEKRYILAPDGLNVGDPVVSSKNADIKPGNSLTLRAIPAAQQKRLGIEPLRPCDRTQGRERGLGDLSQPANPRRQHLEVIYVHRAEHTAPVTVRILTVDPRTEPSERKSRSFVPR